MPKRSAPGADASAAPAAPTAQKELPSTKLCFAAPPEAEGLDLAAPLPLLKAMGYVKDWEQEDSGFYTILRGPEAQQPDEAIIVLKPQSIAVPADMGILLCFYAEIMLMLKSACLGQTGHTVVPDLAKPGMPRLQAAFAELNIPCLVSFNPDTEVLSMKWQGV